MKIHYRSIILFVLFSIFPISFSSSSSLIPKRFLQTIHSAESLGSLFIRNVYQDADSAGAGIDFSVKSISFYRERNLNTGAATYYTRVVVACNCETTEPVDLRLALDDGTVIDTCWADSASTAVRDSFPKSFCKQEFEFETASAPEYAQLDPWHKIANDRNYSNNSLMVDGSLLPVIKWVGRLFTFFQNILLSAERSLDRRYACCIDLWNQEVD